MKTLLSGLDIEQKQAVIDNHDKIVCIAGAGTGKTTTLVHRIAYEVSELNKDPNSILCLTFTNAAANEFELRYKSLVNLEESPYFGTFHSFCYMLVCNESIYRQLGYSSIPSILDESQEKIYTDKAILLSHVSLGKAKLKLSYYPRPKENFEYRVFFKTLRSLLIKDNKITFDILCNDICDLFVKNDPSIMTYKYQYTSLYVDEFQDTDKKQWNFVRSFFGYANIFVVGDINQAIYSFRGADSSIMESIVNDLDWNVDKLQTNYRSTKSICNFANSIFTNSTVSLKSTRSGKDVYLLKSTNENVNRIWKNIASNQQNHTLSDTAVICRTNREVQLVCSYLEDSKFSVNGLDVSLRFSNKVESSNEFYLKCALSDEYYLNYLVSCLSSENRYYIMKNNMMSVKYLKPIMSKFQFLHRVSSLIENVKNLKNSESFKSFESILEFETDSSRQCLISDFAKTYVPQILNTNSEINLNDSNLYIGTIHSVKGLEFKNVWVYNAGSEYFPLNNKENRNLFYVACTRAKDFLVVTSPDPSLIIHADKEK